MRDVVRRERAEQDALATDAYAQYDGGQERREQRDPENAE